MAARSFSGVARVPVLKHHRRSVARNSPRGGHWELGRIRWGGVAHASSSSSAHADFHDASKTFTSLNIHPAVTCGLKVLLETDKPTVIQASAIPDILSNSHTVIAAETGSGKTVAYMAPIFSQIVNQKRDDQASGRKPKWHERGVVVVICPNATLARQVAAVAAELAKAVGASDEGAKVNVDCFVAGVPPPTSPPDVMVTTPATLLGVSDWFGKQKNRQRFVRTMRVVVFDEADVLLSGGLQEDILTLLEWLRIDDKWKRQDEREEGKDREQDAASSSSSPSPPPSSPTDTYRLYDDDEEEDDDSSPAQQEQEVVSADDDVQSLKWRGPRTYVFAGATIPDRGKGSVAGMLRQRYPDAKWARGPRLHNILSERVNQRWINVADNDAAETALKDVLTSDGAFEAGRRTMVFAKTVKAAERVADCVRAAAVEANAHDAEIFVYTKNTHVSERFEMIQAFGERGGIFVCTDSASRGIDVKGGVQHVVQADFAQDAVSYLHRVGRTARAGASGSATSIVRPAEKVLADTLRAAVESGVAIEDSFSRNRQFAKKRKKYGDDHHMNLVRERVNESKPTASSST